MWNLCSSRSLLLLLLLGLPLPSYTSSAPPSPLLRGVAPQDEKLYKSAIIQCKDGSKSFPLSRLNDDFCDCADGTDEPGTSACPEGKFYCRNVGHAPVLIFSSRVNDGLCDCCDGSDEYDGKAKCPNTCAEAGKDSSRKLDRKIAIFKEGLEIRKKEVEHAKHRIQQEKVELSTLKQDEKKWKDVVHKFKAKKEAIETAERQEQLEREKEEQKRREAEKQAAEREIIEAKGTNPDEKSTSEDSSVQIEQTATDDNEHNGEESAELEKIAIDDTKNHGGGGAENKEEHLENQGSEGDSTEGLSKEELGRLVASRWTGEDPSVESVKSDMEEDHVTDFEDDISNDEDEFNPSTHDNGYESAVEDEEEDYETEDADTGDEKLEATASDSETEERATIPSFWERMKEGVKRILRMSKFSTLPIDKSEADYIRKQYEDAASKLAEIQSKISDLEKKLEQDFGREGEFYSFYDRCFELKQKKYVYKVCPYKHALQTESHSSTTLGNWDGFKDEYKSMHFVRGDKCWNGPDRSLKVKLRCGLKTEIFDVDEPSRCEYIAELSTPAVCLEERLISLQQRRIDQAQPTHDEL